MKRERERHIIQCEFLNFSHQKNFKMRLNIFWKNPILTFFDVHSRLAMIPATVVWGPQNPQIIQMWHTRCPFTESAMRIASRKHGPHKWLLGSDALFCGNMSFPHRKTQGCDYCLPPFPGPLDSTQFVFLKGKCLLDRVFGRAQSVYCIFSMTTLV